MSNELALGHLPLHHLDNGEEFIFHEGHVLSIMISNVKVRKMLSKGCKSYLVHVVNKSDKIILSL